MSLTDTADRAIADPATLSTRERALSVAVGLGLAAAALPRASQPIGVVALLAGAYLAYRGATGSCPIKGALSRVA
jgi:uncharacterized membrane protein